MELLLDAEDVAQILKIPKSSAYELMRSGKMRVVRMGQRVRVKEAALQEYIELTEVEPVLGWLERMKL